MCGWGSRALRRPFFIGFAETRLQARSAFFVGRGDVRLSAGWIVEINGGVTGSARLCDCDSDRSGRPGATRMVRAEVGTPSLPTFALFSGWRRNPYGREIYTARHGTSFYLNALCLPH